MATEQERKREAQRQRAAKLKAIAEQKAARKKRGVIIAASVCAAVVVIVAGIIIGVNFMNKAPDYNDGVPAAAPDSPYPQVTFTMEDGGVFVAELYPEVAPNTVNNFISLVKKGFYDGLIFHRVIPGFMIQGGDPEGTGMGGPGYGIKGEFYSNGFKQNKLAHTRGVLSMARSSAPDSAGSQFFVMVDTATHLDGDYAAFGKVVSGMDVVDRIKDAETDANDRPLVEQRIKTVTVDTFGADYPEPVTN
ncbi:hypothetical protein FACS1894208_09740 [Clostridia bacterium]|nr:hypothetical protein FACS1894208_09740 [Clostridia bacterium]